MATNNIDALVESLIGDDSVTVPKTRLLIVDTRSSNDMISDTDPDVVIPRSFRSLIGADSVTCTDRVLVPTNPSRIGDASTTEAS